MGEKKGKKKKEDKNEDGWEGLSTDRRQWMVRNPLLRVNWKLGEKGVGF